MVQLPKLEYMIYRTLRQQESTHFCQGGEARQEWRKGRSARLFSLPDLQSRYTGPRQGGLKRGGGNRDGPDRGPEEGKEGGTQEGMARRGTRRPAGTAHEAGRPAVRAARASIQLNTAPTGTEEELRRERMLAEKP